MPGLDQCIIDKCKKSWEEEFLAGTKNKNNCSGFIKAAARALHIPLRQTANADAIMREVESNWMKLASGLEARQKAALGIFVIAGLKGIDHRPVRAHGHVTIVIDGPLYRGKYPCCWCGSLGGEQGQSQGEKSTGRVWSLSDRDNVAYYAYTHETACKY